MKKVLFFACALLSLMVFADEKLLKAVIDKDTTFYYECDLKAIGEVPVPEDVEMDKLPFNKVTQANEAIEKLMKTLGLDPKVDLVKMTAAAPIKAEDLNNARNIDMNKIKFSGAIQLAKAVDASVIPDAISTYLKDVDQEGICVPGKEGELNSYKLTIKKVTYLMVLAADGKGFLFGTEAGAKEAVARYVSGAIVPMSADLLAIKNTARSKGHYTLLFQAPTELQENLRARAMTMAQGNPIEAGILGEVANVKGMSVVCNMTDKGIELVLSTLLPTPESAMSFKGMVFDGALKPILSMLVMQFASQQLGFIDGMKTSLEGNAARIETVISFEDLKALSAGRAAAPQF